MSSDIVLDISRDETKIKVSVHDRREKAERTLRQYEDSHAAWEQIEAGRREITNLLNRANKRARVTPDILDNLKKTGHVLFDLLIPPKAREKLGSTTATNLILYVDDKLVHIPWELLFDGREFLCRRFAMGRIVSTRQAPTALSSRSLKIPIKVLVLADPRGDLGASYQEGIEIRDFLDERRESFRVNFKSDPLDVPYVKKNLRDYDIVHYAGHADYHPQNPSESGWLLKDGRLKASDISAMGGLAPMPSLVFSNACQTGQTDEWQIQEGYEQQIFGLANAYLLSGVQHYIGTFWEILDEPSSQFAKLFYAFLTQGEQVGEAVRCAREKLIEAYGEETIVWASYMLYGDPTFAFAAAEREVPKAAPIRETAHPEWSPVMRGETSATAPVASAQPAHSSRYLSALIGIVLVVLLGAGGYILFGPDTRKEEVASSPVTTATPTPPQPEKETEKQTPVAIATQKEPIVETKPETVKSKEPDSITVAKSKTAPPLPEAKAPVVIPPAEAKEEIALKTEPFAPVVAEPLTLSMNILGQRKGADGRYSEVVVGEGSVLRSYDNLQVHFETNRPAYVYVLLYDSTGRASQIFPDPKIDQPWHVESGRKIVVPSKDLWFWLDESTGTETIYVLASEKPMSDIRTLLARMETADESGKQRFSQEIKQKIVQRGLAVVAKGSAVTYSLSDGKKIQKVTDVVTGTGSVVRAVSFHHR